MGREVKGISFTDDYKYEMARLTNEKNGSKLVCELLRSYYNNEYSFSNIENDMVHIKDVLNDIVEKLSKKNE